MADRMEVRVNTEATPGEAPAGFTDKSPEGAKVARVAVDPSQVPDPTPPVETPGEALLAGKYKTPADLEKAYKELEAKLGQQRTAETPQDTTKPVQTPSTDTTTNLNEFVSEFADKGKLSDETYSKLAAKGIDKATADAYMAGQKALADVYIGKLHAQVGGKDAYEQMAAWAKTNLTPSEAQAVTKALQSGDESLAGIALSGLQAKYVAANGKAPALVKGGEAAPTTGVQPFADNDEYIRAISDKRYQTSEAYRQSVYKRLAASDTIRVRPI